VDLDLRTARRCWIAGLSSTRPEPLATADQKRQASHMVAAYAHTNIALIKYWGKRPGSSPGLNLPAVGSLSMTLDRFGTHTGVSLADEDRFELNETLISGPEAQRVVKFLDVVRARAGRPERAHVWSRNDVPTAAGLASSASAFAALALAASHAYGLPTDLATVSSLARMGSGSAARSLHGGLVLLQRGQRDDGEDCLATALSMPPALQLRLVVVRCGEGKKATGSTVGMDHTAATSPYFGPWVSSHAADLVAAQTAIDRADLAALGEVMEHSTLKMHATTMAARPGFLYFQPTTIAVLQRVWELRSEGVGAWATMDAGPHVKILCAPADAPRVELAAREVVGVRGVEVCSIGPPAHIVDG
jgi:diphosphomevalonate decarboxylase